MKKDGKSKVKGKISTKKEAKETIDMFKSISDEWEVNLETDETTANFKGIRKGEGVPKSGLTSADKEWIADLVISTVKSINDGLDVIEQDIKTIKECLTIKKEFKKRWWITFKIKKIILWSFF